MNSQSNTEFRISRNHADHDYEIPFESTAHQTLYLESFGPNHLFEIPSLDGISFKHCI